MQAWYVYAETIDGKCLSSALLKNDTVANDILDDMKTQYFLDMLVREMVKENGSEYEEVVRIVIPSSQIKSVRVLYTTTTTKRNKNKEYEGKVSNPKETQPASIGDNDV